MRLLISGSDGVVGSVLCADLKDDFELISLTRPERSPQGFDVTDPTGWQALSPRLDQGLDGLIHTVGSFHHDTLEATDASTWRQLIASNLDSAFYAYQASIKGLRHRRGRIIFFTLAGISSVKPEVNLAAYAAAKAGLASLGASIAAAEAEHGVTCNMIAPGLLHNASVDEVERYAVPAGRPAHRHELCAAVRYLLSDEAAQVTATTLPLSGGWRI
jgi:3-oxoacyl-[acyl-carrier protein] reductase